MNELHNDDLREIVTAAAGTILDDADNHVERYWQGLGKKSADQTIGDQPESGGFGVDIIPEIVALAQYAWSYAQSHAANVADGIAANAFYAVLIAAILKWRWPSGKTGLSEEERQAVAERIADRVMTRLENTGRLPSRLPAADKAPE